MPADCSVRLTALPHDSNAYYVVWPIVFCIFSCGSLLHCLAEGCASFPSNPQQAGAKQAARLAGLPAKHQLAVPITNGAMLRGWGEGPAATRSSDSKGCESPTHDASSRAAPRFVSSSVGAGGRLRPPSGRTTSRSWPNLLSTASPSLQTRAAARGLIAAQRVYTGSLLEGLRASARREATCFFQCIFTPAWAGFVGAPTGDEAGRKGRGSSLAQSAKSRGSPAGQDAPPRLHPSMFFSVVKTMTVIPKPFRSVSVTRPGAPSRMGPCCTWRSGASEPLTPSSLEGVPNPCAC